MPNGQGRFEVSRIGTPIPRDSRYLVLDVVYDFEARVAARKLVANYRRNDDEGRAQEVERLLDESADAHEAAMKARNPKAKKSDEKKRTHA